MADYNNTLTWVFSEEAPVEPAPMRWVFKVSGSTIKLTRFNAEPFRRDAPDPAVQKLVDGINQNVLEETVVTVAAFHTRNSFAAATTSTVAPYLRSSLAGLGCQSVRLATFRSGYAPNILCELPGTDTSLPMVYVGAHYDSRGFNTNSATERAPGADDNGSGTAGVLEILRVITSNRATFRRTISFALWAGEEQGLVGSDEEAYRLRNLGVQILAYVNLDMIGYPSPSYPNALWWVSRGTTPELTDLGVELTKTYLGASTEIRLSTGCCSDQQSFLYYNYPAASVFESSSATLYPDYHKPTDTPDKVDYAHARRTTQAAASLLLTLAEPVS